MDKNKGFSEFFENLGCFVLVITIGVILLIIYHGPEIADKILGK